MAGFFPVVILLIALISICGCVDNNSNSAEETNRVTGETCRIQLKKTRTISSNNLDDPEVLFTDFERATNGTVYLLDGKSVKIRVFDPSGTLQKVFLNHGNGPGEFQPHPKLQILDNHLWILGLRKIGKFSLDGELIEEFKLDKYYRSIRLVDDRNFLASHEVFANDGNGSHSFKKIIGLFDLRSETLKQTFIEAQNVGRMMISLPKKRVMSVIPGPRILSDLIYNFDSTTNTVYCSYTERYRIFKQPLSRKTAESISIHYDPSRFSEEEKQYIAGTFRNVDPSIKKQIASMLPDSLPAIHELRILNSEHLLVRRITGARDTVCDILDTSGSFHCTAIFTPELSPRRLKIYNSTIAIIKETDDGNLYQEFNIQNFGHIFGKPTK